MFGGERVNKLRIHIDCKLICFQVPNKQGGGEISENLNKWGGVKINRGGWEFSEKFNNIYSTFRVQKHANNRWNVYKLHARKRKVLAEHLLFLLWPLIHYQT